MDLGLMSTTCDASSEIFWTGKSLASALFLSSLATPSESVITWISQQSSYAWFFKLTQFETIFLGFILAQIFVLRWLEILPLNLNKLFDGDPAGRRKKRAIRRDPSLLDDDHLGNSMFKLLRKLDDEECILKALCAIESNRFSGYEYPRDTRKLLTVLSTSGKRADVNPIVTDATRLEEKRSNWSIRTFQLATLRGQEDFRRNGTICQNYYSGCSLSVTDIVDYVDIISGAGML